MIGVMLAVLGVVSSSINPPLRVFVEEGPVSKTLLQGLIRELPKVVLASEPAAADVQVSALSDGDALALSVRGADGALLLERRVPFDPEDSEPSVRVAILLVVRAARGLPRAPVHDDGETPPIGRDVPTPAIPPSPSTPPVPASASRSPVPAGSEDSAPPWAKDEDGAVSVPSFSQPGPSAPREPALASTAQTATASRTPWLELRAGLTGGGWLRPATPLIGFFGGVGARFGPVRVGARTEVAGLLCCELSDARLQGDALEAAFLAELSVRFARLEPIDFEASAAVGAAYVEVRGQPDDVPGFPVGLAEQAANAWGPQLRLALGVEWPVAPSVFILGLWAGFQLRPDRLVVDLPARDGEAPSVDAGPIMPWFAVAASVPIL